MRVLGLLKDYALPAAMLTGTVAYPLISRLSFLIPLLIFSMLFLSFCKLRAGSLRVRPAHIWLLAIQIAGSLAVYAAINPFSHILAQGAFMCVFVPTATAAVVITGMLGGNVAFLTTYLLLCNVAVALAAPLLLPLVGSSAGITFTGSLLGISMRVGPVLILPLLSAWIIRYTAPKVNAILTGIRGLSFALWTAALAIVTATTVDFLASREVTDYVTGIRLALVSLVICVCQFVAGRRLGRRYADPVSCGQGLGQKNTILAIWLAQAYLHPISSVAPAAYILWQNIINSYQLHRAHARSHRPS
jgi:BASS family bile acid:Na+ symporter